MPKSLLYTYKFFSQLQTHTYVTIFIMKYYGTRTINYLKQIDLIL